MQAHTLGSGLQGVGGQAAMPSTPIAIKHTESLSGALDHLAGRLEMLRQRLSFVSRPKQEAQEKVMVDPMPVASELTYRLISEQNRIDRLIREVEEMISTLEV